MVRNFDPLITTFDIKIIKDLKSKDIFFSRGFIKLWALIYKHGERMTLNNVIQEAIEPVNQGRCIMHSRHNVINNASLLRNQYRDYHYCEGITNQSCLSLHAWNAMSNTRHYIAIEETRGFLLDLIPLSWYQGIVFDIDFLDWCRTVQHKNKGKDTMPYLSSGYSCLTYKPLLDGKLAQYRMDVEDYKESLEQLIKFAQSADLLYKRRKLLLDNNV